MSITECIDGEMVTRNLTPEEVERFKNPPEDIPAEPTTDERLTGVEAQIDSLKSEQVQQNDGISRLDGVIDTMEKSYGRGVQDA